MGTITHCISGRECGPFPSPTLAVNSGCALTFERALQHSRTRTATNCVCRVRFFTQRSTRPAVVCSCQRFAMSIKKKARRTAKRVGVQESEAVSRTGTTHKVVDGANAADSSCRTFSVTGRFLPSSDRWLIAGHFAWRLSLEASGRWRSTSWDHRSSNIPTLSFSAAVREAIRQHSRQPIGA